MAAKLTKLGRRVLGHLPVWHEDEAWLIEQEGGPLRVDEETGEVLGSERTYSLPEFTARLAEDPTALVEDGESDPRPLNEADCEVALEALVTDGLAERDDDGDEARWRMTEEGRDALVAPADDDEPQTPGAVTIPMHPARSKMSARAAGRLA